MQFATEVKTYTCICCPLGCVLEVSFDQRGEIIEVAGNSCTRGKEYAIEEATNPVRMVTAIVHARGSLEPLSVKTATPVPKALIYKVLAAIAELDIAAPLEAGTPLINDVCGTGVSVVATKSIRGA